MTACGDSGSANDAETSGQTDETQDTGTATGETGTDDGEPESLCGNGELDPGEACDDGNTNDLDACTGTCEIPGSLRWEDLFDGPVSGEDGVEDVAVDANGNVYSLGWVDTAEVINSDDIWLRKFDGAGNELWTRTFDGVALPYTERGDAVAVAPNGDVVFAAVDFEDTGFDGQNVRLVRLTPDGDVVWDVIYEGAAGLTDSASELAIRADGAIFVVGSQEFADTSDAWIARYDADGVLQAELLVDGGGNERDSFAGIALMPDGGSVVVGGVTAVAGEDDDAWIRRMDADFNLVWETLVDGETGEDDSASFVGVTPEGDIVVAGSMRGPNSSDAWVAKYDDSGQEVWSLLRDGALNGLDFATAMAVDGAGNIAVGGIERNNPDSSVSPFLLKLDGDGNEVWSLANDVAELPQTRFLRSIAMSPDHCIVIGGSDKVVTNESYLGWTRVHAP